MQIAYERVHVKHVLKARVLAFCGLRGEGNQNPGKTTDNGRDTTTLPDSNSECFTTCVGNFCLEMDL